MKLSQHLNSQYQWRAKNISGSNLETLALILKKKQTYIKKRQYVKASRKVIKAQQNLQNYIQTQRLRPNHLKTVDRMGQILSQFYRTQKLNIFTILKRSYSRQYSIQNINQNQEQQFQEPLVSIIGKIFGQKKSINTAFSFIKLYSLIQKKVEQVKPTLQKCIQNIRLFQFEGNPVENCFEAPFQCIRHADIKEIEQRSVEELMGLSLDQNEVCLHEKVIQLRQEYKETVRKCNQIKLNLSKQHVQRGQNQWGEDSESEQTEFNVGQNKLGTLLDIDSAEWMKQKESQEAIDQLLHRYQCLNQQADMIRSTVDLIIHQGGHKNNCEQDVLATVLQIRRILMLQPLG